MQLRLLNTFVLPEKDELAVSDWSHFVTSALFLGEVFYHVKSEQNTPFKVSLPHHYKVYDCIFDCWHFWKFTVLACSLFFSYIMPWRHLNWPHMYQFFCMCFMCFIFVSVSFEYFSVHSKARCQCNINVMLTVTPDTKTIM